MNSKDLAKQLTPRVQVLCKNMVPAIKEAVGTLKWIAIVGSFGITWTILTSEKVLPVIIQHGIEFGVASSKKYVDPLLAASNSLIPLLESIISDQTQLNEIKNYLSELQSLYSTSVQMMCPAVQGACSGDILPEANDKEFDFFPN